MKCPNCHGYVQAGWKACPFCGKPLQKKKCFSCDKELELSWKVCPFCGKDASNITSGGIDSREGVMKAGGDIVGGNKIVFDKESRIATKTGEFCHSCKRLLTDEYFICDKCKTNNCLDCRDTDLRSWCVFCSIAEPKVKAAAQKAKQLPRQTYFLRSKPETVSNDEAMSVFGLNYSGEPLEYIPNTYEDNEDGTITDYATGLMWQQTGSEYRMGFNEAVRYIYKLNQERFAGYNDWRLPTVEELFSLLEPEYNPNAFDWNSWCWSSDKRSSNSAWYVRLENYGKVTWNFLNFELNVLATRSRR